MPILDWKTQIKKGRRVYNSVTYNTRRKRIKELQNISLKEDTNITSFTITNILQLLKCLT